MAHEFNRDLEDILNGADEVEGDPQQDFEAYLKEKTCRIDPVSEMRELVSPESASLPANNARPLPPSVQKLELEMYPGLTRRSVPGAVDSSSNSMPSVTDATDESPASSSVSAADEKTVKLELHKHPVAGGYITERTEAVSVDEEWQKVFSETNQVVVKEMTAEQVIDRFHQLDRAIFLMRAQQHGLRVGLEELLKAQTASERNRLLELDRKYKTKSVKNAVTSIREKRAQASTGKATSKGKTKGMKTVDTLKGLMMGKEKIADLLKQQSLNDEHTLAYLDRQFS